MAKKAASKKIRIDDVRFSFVHVFEKDQYGNYSTSFIFPPDHPATAAVKDAIREVATQYWGDKAADVLKKLKAQDRLCLHSGDSKNSEEYDGMLFVSANNKTKAAPNTPKGVKVVGPGREALTEEDGKPYSGCYGNAVLNIWTQDNGFGQRVNADLLGLQFTRDGDAFGGGGPAASADEFDEVEAGASADTFGDDLI